MSSLRWGLTLLCLSAMMAVATREPVQVVTFREVVDPAAVRGGVAHPARVLAPRLHPALLSISGVRPGMRREALPPQFGAGVPSPDMEGWVHYESSRGMVEILFDYGGRVQAVTGETLQLGLETLDDRDRKTLRARLGEPSDTCYISCGILDLELYEEAGLAINRYDGPTTLFTLSDPGATQVVR